MAKIARLGGIVSKDEAAGISTIKTYNFKRPDKFSKEQIRTVSIMHETFARLSSTSLSAQLRAFSHMHVAAVDQLTYEEFLRSIPDPTTMAVINMNPLLTNALLQIDPDIQFAILDRLFGGTGVPLEQNRDITDIECSITEEVILQLLNNLRQAWQPIIDLRPSLRAIETRPQFAQIVPPVEMIMLVTIEAKVANAEGMINLCIPYLTIEPIIEKLSAKYMYSTVGHKGYGSKIWADAVHTETGFRIILDGPDLNINELGDLKSGSLIPLPQLDGINESDTYPWILEMGEEQICTMAKDTKSWHFSFNSELPYPELLSTEQQTEAPKPVYEKNDSLSEVLGKFEKKLDSLIQAQNQIADEVTMPSGQGRVSTEPFAFVRLSDCGGIAKFISQEHPQLIALILWYLEPESAALVLGALPEETQPEIIRRISVMDRVDPKILAQIERMFEKKLSAFSVVMQHGKNGIETAVGILNMAQRQVERSIIQTLEKTAPEISEGIKQRMFVFEDIVLLDRKAIEKLTAVVDSRLLAIALKGVDDEVKKIITDALSSERKIEVETIKKKVGKVRLKDVEDAQLQVVQKIRELEENGDIIVAHPDEGIVE